MTTDEYHQPQQPGSSGTAPYYDPRYNPSWIGRVAHHHYQAAPTSPLTQQAHIWGHQQVRSPGSSTKVTLNVILLLVITGVVACILLLFFVLPNLVAAGGPAGVIVGFLLSLVPLFVVLLSVYFIDRWEPEPKYMLMFALIWGVAVSIGTTLLIQPIWVALFLPHGLSKPEALAWLAHYEAPPVEEFSKGLGVLLVALFARKYMDGIVDGVVYATVIAAGFAFTENIQYFGTTFSDTHGNTLAVGITFLVRGIFSPFGHALYTACTGAAIGWSVRKNSKGFTIVMFFVGLLPAMWLHHLWNSAQLFFEPTTVPELIGAVVLQSIVYELPLMVLWIIGLMFLRRAEVKLTGARLNEYCAAGWFSPEEVTMLATPAGRRHAMVWARGIGRARLMKQFITKATTLAYTRQRMLTGSDLASNQAAEHALLGELQEVRARMVGQVTA